MYQLDYNEEGIKHKDEYVRMFQDCGWEYIQDYAGYSYFRKPVSQMQGKMEEIFCDDESRLEMMRRMFLGRYTPLFIILVLLILPNLFLQLHSKEPGRPGACGAVPHLAGGLRLGVCLLCPPVLEAQAPVREISIGPSRRKAETTAPGFSRGGCHPFVRLLGGAAGGRGASSKHANPRKNLGLTAFT